MNSFENAITSIVSPNIIQLYLMFKYKATRDPSYFENNTDRGFINCHFIERFNTENSTLFSLNEFELVLEKLYTDGLFKKMYKFECSNCRNITLIKEKGDNAVYNMVFNTGCVCKYCLESSSISVSQTNTRKVVFYCLADKQVDEDIFNPAKISDEERRQEEVKKAKELESWKRLKQVGILAAIILILWILLFL